MKKRITLLSLSDYHSHAVPFYSEGKHGEAGISRAIAYFKAQKAADPNLLIVCSGDMVNMDTPVWSDEFPGIELPWLNGLVDIMALGNHDMDYGPEIFDKINDSTDFPIICGNLLDPQTHQPFLTVDDKPYVVREIDGVKVGMFALAGSDFDMLVKPQNRPRQGLFVDRIPLAHKIVQQLRHDEKVDVVIYIGHSSREDDLEMAQQVSGIDLILGSHSHHKSELIQLPQTNTWFISPFQYLAYVCRVELEFDDNKLVGVKGGLVKMDQQMPQDYETTLVVDEIQAELLKRRPERFAVLGTAKIELSYEGGEYGETLLGNWVTDICRRAVPTHLFMLQAISLRGSLPPGPITLEDLLASIPYKNSLVVVEMSGEQVKQLIELSVSLRGLDTFCQVSGVRFDIVDNRAENILILADPANEKAGYLPLDHSKTYSVGTTGYQMGVPTDYRNFFSTITEVTRTRRDIGKLLIETLKTAPVFSRLDGRMSNSKVVR